MRPVLLLCGLLLCAPVLARPAGAETPPAAVAAVDASAEFDAGIARADAGDPAAAAEHYARAAAAGHTGAMTLLGTAYVLGEGVPRDWSQARHWLETAVAGGDGHAAIVLAEVYRSSLGPPSGPVRDRAQAASLIRFAAMHCNVPAQVELAGLLHDGRDLERDPVAALAWAMIAGRDQVYPVETVAQAWTMAAEWVPTLDAAQRDAARDLARDLDLRMACANVGHPESAGAAPR